MRLAATMALQPRGASPAFLKNIPIRGRMDLRTTYLFGYNLLQFYGWARALLLLLPLLRSGELDRGYEAAGSTVELFQLLAALEIVHAVLGLVGGSPITAIMQWAGRSNVLFAVVKSVPEVRDRATVGILFVAWALSEVIRYPWYAATLADRCPAWLTWLRYTAFIGLYPIGVVAEMKSVYDALPYLRQRGWHSITMPNRWNVAFDYHTFSVVLLVVYPFLWLQLYLFLFRQRTKKLRQLRPTGKTA